MAFCCLVRDLYDSAPGRVYSRLSVNAVEVSGKVNRSHQMTGDSTTVIAPSMMKTHCHESKPALPLRLSMPTARKPDTAEASALAEWKTAMRHALSVGLYQKVK
jgi:hypothetical protein